MSKPFEEKPTEWAVWGDHEIVDVGSDIFYTIVGDGISVGDKATNVWVWHWHTPTSGVPARWQISGCGLHDVMKVEPLTLSPSLACEDGCPNHGYIVDGVWKPV